MTRQEEIFLNILRAGLSGEKYTLPEPEWTDETIAPVFSLAASHRLLSLVYDTVSENGFLRKAKEGSAAAEFKKQALADAIRQLAQQNEMLLLLEKLEKQDLRPIIVKGMVLKALYPMPCLRTSVDEDLLIPQAEAPAYDAFFLKEGLTRDDPEADPAQETELSYHKEGSPLYIELHTRLFPPESKAYADCNRFFSGVYTSQKAGKAQDCSGSAEQQMPAADESRKSADAPNLTGDENQERLPTAGRKAETDDMQEVVIDGLPVQTLPPTEHLLYQILHVYKHFVHSGFGIRYVADITMFANAYGENLDWEWIFAALRELGIGQFALAIFKIGEKYLRFSPENARFPYKNAMDAVDEAPLLSDILGAGIDGTSSEDRLHSSLITLKATEDAKKTGMTTQSGYRYGKEDSDRRNPQVGEITQESGGNGTLEQELQGQPNEARRGSGRLGTLVKAAFPPARSLATRYPYLKKAPILLPIAWVSRIGTYLGKTRHGGVSAKDSVKIGQTRVELMRYYNML